MRSIRRTAERAAPAIAGAIACAIATFGVACGGGLAPPIPAAHPDDEAPRRGGTLHLASIGDLRTLDPAVAADQLSALAIRLVYAGLVDFARDGAIEGDLAERFEASSDGTTYRFFLREGARFHDGAEVTADDVKRSIERALAPTTPNPQASFYAAIDGFDAYTGKKAEHLAGVVVEGRYVVAIHLRHPDATFLDVLALTPLRVVCRSAGARYGDAFAPCGAGPFKLLPGGWERGRSLTLVRNDAYFRPGLPYLDAVNVALSMTPITERFKFERGELDDIRDLTQADTGRLLLDPRWAPHGAYESDRMINGEAMNTEVPPFDNVEVRRAVAAALDRAHLVALKATNLRAAGGPFPPALRDVETVPGQTHDEAAALDHMRRAGLAYDPATGRGGWPKPIPYVVYKQGLYEFTGQVVQQELAKIGLRLDLRMVSYPAYLALTRRRGKAAMSPQAWTQDYPDPSDFLEPLFASEAINDEDSNNTAFYANPRLDALLARAHREVDPTARRALYADAQRIVIDDAPWAFTFTYRFYDVHQPYLRGYAPHAVWPHDVAGAWLDRAAEAVATGGGVFGRGALASIVWGARAKRGGR